MSDFFRLDGKVALVTGAAAGIGAAIAEALAAAGADGPVTATRAPQTPRAALVKAQNPKGAALSGDSRPRHTRAACR